MNSRKITLSVERSADLLSGIFPNQDWPSFLAANRLGLTEGFPPIPYDDSSSGIAFQLGDLEEFAIGFGSGERCPEYIASFIEGLMTYLSLVARSPERKHDLAPNGFAGDFCVKESIDGSFWMLAALTDFFVAAQKNGMPLAEAKHAAVILAEEVACEVGMERSLPGTRASHGQSTRTKASVDQIRTLLNELETSFA
jgi:hypothetical protein